MELDQLIDIEMAIRFWEILFNLEHWVLNPDTL